MHPQFCNTYLLMRKLTCFAVVALAAAATLSACKKDEDKSITGAERKSTLVANQWKIAEIRWGGAVMTDSLLDACDKDNYMVFTAAGKYAELEGANKCTAGQDTSDKGAYAFSTDYSQVTLTPADGSGAETGKVTEFKEGAFTVETSALGLAFITKYVKK